jgi:hypothetical protein
VKRGYHKKYQFSGSLYSNKLESLIEMDKFPDSYDLHKLSQEDISQLNRSIASKEIEAVIKCCSKKKSPGLNGFTAKFY